MNVLTVGLIPYYAFVVPFLAITAQPHLLRVLEILCRYSYLSNKDIACRLSLSTRSVETYINTLIHETGVDNRRQLVCTYEFYYLAQEDGAG